MFFTRWLPNSVLRLCLLAARRRFCLGTRGRSGHSLHGPLTARIWLIVLELTLVRFASVLNFNYRDYASDHLDRCRCRHSGLVFLPDVGGRDRHRADPLHNLSDGLTWDHSRERVGSGRCCAAADRAGAVKNVRMLAIYRCCHGWRYGAGYGFGRLLKEPPPPARMYRVGITLTLAFLVLRAINRYGDPVHWTGGNTSAYAAMSF